MARGSIDARRCRQPSPAHPRVSAGRQAASDTPRPSGRRGGRETSSTCPPPDGYPWPLRRGRVKDRLPRRVRRRSPYLVVRPLVAEGLATPEPRHDLQPLIEHLAPHAQVRLLAQILPLEGQSAIPTPRTSRPSESWSRVAASQASCVGRRRGRGVTRGPNCRVRVLHGDRRERNPRLHQGRLGQGQTPAGDPRGRSHPTLRPPLPGPVPRSPARRGSCRSWACSVRTASSSPAPSRR